MMGTGELSQHRSRPMRCLLLASEKYHAAILKQFLAACSEDFLRGWRRRRAWKR